MRNVTRVGVITMTIPNPIQPQVHRAVPEAAPPRSEWRSLLLMTGIFLGVMLVICLHRYFTYYASYDQGLFNQIFWNNLHGRWFQSSLTSANSVAVLADKEIPIVNFVHFGQHFVPTFLLWLPLYAILPHPATLIGLQVVLMAAGGVALYFLARHHLDVKLSQLITASYFGAIAVVAPTFANFYEHCQFPLFTFGMLLALEKRRWWWFWGLVLLVLGIREDAGITLFGIGLLLLLSRRSPKVGAALCVLSFVYVAVVTNVVIMQFSHDNPRLYMSDRFQQFVPGNPAPSTLEVLWGMITHPVALVQTLFSPFHRRFFYLIGQWLPLAFIPAISPATWVLTAPPLIALFAQSKFTALEISIRYAVAIVPGVFYGVILWWSQAAQRIGTPRPEGWRQLGWTWRYRQLSPRFRQFWVVCLVISVGYSVVTNPNQAFYFLIPDSIRPWVMVTLPEQWHRTGIMNRMVREVSTEASVSATTHLIPPLSSRRKIIRPPNLLLQDENGVVEEMDDVLLDFWRIERYMPISQPDRRRMEILVPWVDKLMREKNYGIVDFEDKILLLRQGVPSNPVALAGWEAAKPELLASLAKYPPRSRSAVND